MTRFIFSWEGEEGRKEFATSCPQIGEVFMRSVADFPKLTPAMRDRFQELYSGTRGQFEELLREGPTKPYQNLIESDIPGLTIRMKQW